MGTVTVDRCSRCKGTWFDGDELEHALDVTTRGIARDEAENRRRGLPRPPNPSEEVRYLACVRCGERMARRQIAARTGLIIDICRFHGVWFDGGELEHFREFVAAGGLEVLRHDGVAQADAWRKRTMAAGRVPSPWMVTPSADPWVGGELLHDLWRLLRSILNR